VPAASEAHGGAAAARRDDRRADVNWESWIGGLIAVALCTYLLYALFAAERF
jgi:K+-transporting ATPase KdpF subunit